MAVSSASPYRRLVARYWLETPADPEKVAAVMAGEQSTGTFVRLPNETDELIERCGAVVENVQVLEASQGASLPTARRAADIPVRRALVDISWGEANFGYSLPNMLATVAGNLFELRDVTGLRLQSLSLPDGYAKRYPGPQFGASGTRDLTGVADGPLIGTIIKPSVGLSPDETAAVVKSLCEGGIDFIKDDELQADGSHCPFDERVAAVMRVVNDHAARTGKKVMVAFNITDDIERMLRHHDTVLAHEGTCVMVSLNSVGVAGVEYLRRRCALPIHGHRNGWGYLSRHPSLGFDYDAWQVLWRLAGVDHMHVNGLRNKFSETDESVMASASALSRPLFSDGLPGYQAMPVFSSGQWAEQALETRQRLGHADLIYTCGGGIVAHPDGIGAGVESVRVAWEGAERGLSVQQVAQENAAVRQALAFFGK